MVKRICAIILTVIIVLFAVSMSFVVKLGLNAKDKEYYDRDYDQTRYGYDYYEEAFKKGELTLQDTLNGLCVYENDAQIPVASYNVVCDKDGNVVAESGSMLEIEFFNDDYYSGKMYYVNLEPYLTEEVRKQMLDIFEITGYHRLGIFDTVELSCKKDTIIPVAFETEYEDETYRVELSDKKANVILGDGNGHNGKFCFLEYNLKGEMLKHYDYLKRVAYKYVQQQKDGEELVDMSEGTGGNPYPHTEESVVISTLKLDGEKYYFIQTEAANSVYSMLSDENYIMAFITITAVYVLVGAALCIVAVKIKKKRV